MRTIAFRGKRKDNGDWVHGDLLQVFVKKEPLKFIIPHGSDCPKSMKIGNIQKEVDETTLGQFTGLLDKNGKSIFEGDILSTNDKIVGHVMGGFRGYCFEVIFPSPLRNGEESWPLYGTLMDDYHNQLSVTGNIYDNKELINKMKGGRNVDI